MYLTAPVWLGCMSDGSPTLSRLHPLVSSFPNSDQLLTPYHHVGLRLLLLAYLVVSQTEQVRRDRRQHNVATHCP